MDNEPVIPFRVKDLIADQNKVIERIEGKVDKAIDLLNQKPDRSELVALTARVAVVEGSQRDRAARLSTLNRVWLTVLSVAAIVVPVILTLKS